LNLATGQELVTLETPPLGDNGRCTIGFTPDGHRLVALISTRDAGVPRFHVWDATPVPESKK
jgi:hypothetical protein